MGEGFTHAGRSTIWLFHLLHTCKNQKTKKCCARSLRDTTTIALFRGELCHLLLERGRVNETHGVLCVGVGVAIHPSFELSIQKLSSYDDVMRKLTQGLLACQATFKAVEATSSIPFSLLILFEGTLTRFFCESTSHTPRARSRKAAPEKQPYDGSRVSRRPRRARMPRGESHTTHTTCDARHPDPHSQNFFLSFVTHPFHFLTGIMPLPLPPKPRTSLLTPSPFLTLASYVSSGVRHRRRRRLG